MELYTVALVSLLAAISPGPDFLVVLRNSLVYSRASGMMTALGVSTALIVHLTYTLVGIGILISQSPSLYMLMTRAGALYLLYIGIKGICATVASQEALHTKSDEPLLPQAAFMHGFLTNLLNPKCALFFISFFSQCIEPTTPTIWKLAYGFTNWSITCVWFLFFAYIITSDSIQKRLFRFRIAIDRVMGGALIYLGIRILL